MSMSRELRTCWVSTRLAEAGATEYQLMAVMGWTNPAQAMKYIEAARRRKMATGAYDKLETEQNKDKDK